MKCILIFDGLNDVIYSKCNEEFLKHTNTYAKKQGLIPKQCSDNEEISSNVIVQIFSPLVTSHRIMSCEFGNTYYSIECDEGIRLVFEEFMGHLFVAIGKEKILSLKTFLRISISIVRSVCNANIETLKSDLYSSVLVSSLLDSWENLRNIDQAIKVEAIEQLTVNADLSSISFETLREVVSKIKFPKVHAMIIVQNKFLSLYSSQAAKQLSPTDILLLTILNNMDKTEIGKQSFQTADNTTPGDLYLSTASEASLLNVIEACSTDIDSYYVYLAGYKVDPACVPYAVHIIPITQDIRLLALIESPTIATVSIRIYEAFLHLYVLQNLQVQRDMETMKQALQNLEVAVAKLTDSLRNLKIEKVEVNQKIISAKWKQTKKMYQELFKESSDETLLKAESSLCGLTDILRKFFDLIACDYLFLMTSQKFARNAANAVVNKLKGFNDILKVKAIKNFSLGSHLEQFPGLIHFIYIDRTAHRIIAPSLDVNTEDETNYEFKAEIWEMIEFSQQHLEDGHLSLIWKDSSFIFAYFLWFEDSMGTPIKPMVYPSQLLKKLPKPGILNGDFYYKLKQNCFPKLSPNKVRCYELYSVHLKIVAPALILDHMRRLMATIWEIKGYSNHPMELL